MNRLWSFLRPRLAWSLLTVVVPLYAAFYVLALTRPAVIPVCGDAVKSNCVLAFSAGDVVWVASFVAFTVVGALIAGRRPEHPIGWLFLGVGATSVVSVLGYEYAVRSLFTSPWLPGGAVASWLAAWTWSPGLGLIVVAALLFPTGKPLSPRWRWLIWLVGAPTVVITVVSAVGTWSLRGRVLLGEVDAAAGHWTITVVSMLFPLVLLAAILSLVGLVVRYRRARGIERAQLKWLALVAVVMAGSIVTGETVALEGAARNVVDILGTPLWFPVAAGVAILRHNLFDIDRIVSRTVTYALITAVLASLYVAVAVLPSTLFGLQSDLFVAAATLTAAAAFGPVRRRIQNLVDGRFNRNRYDARRTIESFGVRLREELDLDALRDEVEVVARATMHPSHIHLWLTQEHAR